MCEFADALSPECRVLYGVLSGLATKHGGGEVAEKDVKGILLMTLQVGQ